MKDLGLGLLDRRTVIVSLFTIVIINTVFQYNLPIRTSNAGELFLDLVLFTGYIYLARSLFRLPFAILLMFIGGVLGVYWSFQNFQWTESINKMTEKETTSKIKIISAKTAHIFAHTIKEFFYTSTFTPTFINRFLNIDGELGKLELLSYDTTTFKKFLGLVRLIDRGGFIALVAFATLPQYMEITKSLGVIGLVILVLIYLVKGNFTFLIKDKITEEQKEQSDTA